MSEGLDTRILIKQLDASTARRICSSQVITSMAVAVKELIENAIDARASYISIRFADYGKELIEVIDNGCGIEKDNFDLLGKRNCTSKLESFEELDSVGTFGFRGEALSSLCNIANLTVHTRHVSDEIGSFLKFDANGSMASKEKRARNIGTTVSLAQLFYSLPVRRKELLSGHKPFDKTLSLIYQYCTGMVGLKISCLHKTNQEGQYKNLFTSSGYSLQSNITEIFPTQFSNLMPFVCSTDLEGTSTNTINLEISGYISKPDTRCGRSTADRQFFYLNGRPCDLDSVSKRINQIYRTYNRNQYPFVLLKITVDEHLIDRNLTPDKRKIFLADSHYIFKVIQHSLELMFSRENSDVLSLSSSQIMSNYLNNSSLKRDYPDSQPDQSPPQHISKIFKRCSSPCDALFQSDNNDNSIQDITNVEKPIYKEKVTTTIEPVHAFQDNSFVSSKKAFERQSNVPQSKQISKPIKHPFFASFSHFQSKSSVVDNKNKDITEEVEMPNDDDILNNSNSNSAASCGESLNYKDDNSSALVEELIVDNEKVNDEDDTDTDQLEDISELHDETNDSSDIDDYDPSTRQEYLFECDIEHICEQYIAAFEPPSTHLSQHETNFNAKIIPEDNEKALNELRLTLSKQSFSQMKVVGQFNLGFIIAKLNSDLFIIDQHAIDERFNFEALLKDPKLDYQNLLKPLNLRLSSQGEMIVIDHQQTFSKLGFGILVDKEAAVGERVRLAKIPLGKGWVGGRSDVEEIIAAIRDSPTGDILEGRRFMLSGLQREVAYRACRSSVMIGEHLKPSHMAKMLTKLTDLRDPWHCAHNRPTIRHLIHLHLKSLL